MKTITYLRDGRKLRSSGEVIWRSKDGITKVKPAREGWGCVLVTPEEIEAGKEKPPYQPRKKSEAPTQKPKRQRKPKPQPLPKWKQLIDEVRIMEIDHVPEGWPAVKMHTITALADELEAAHAKLSELLPLQP